MFSLLRNRFGIPGVISVIALVFAMLGGAYAANSSGGGKATASAKGKPGPRGKTGKTGPAGPAGPQGPAGANGKDGSNGSNGQDGAPGAVGAPGTSVTSEEFGTAGKEGKCVGTGGSKFVAGAGKTFACNGAAGEPGDAGAPGPKGDPWTPNNELPSGARLTGVWTFEAREGDTEVVAPISFPIRLPEELGEAETHFQGEENFATKCPGTVIEPNAVSGNLCVYFGGGGTPTAGATFVNFTDPTVGVPGAAVAGSLMHFTVTGAAHGYGTWAVRG